MIEDRTLQSWFAGRLLNFFKIFCLKFSDLMEYVEIWLGLFNKTITFVEISWMNKLSEQLALAELFNII